jgi:uncharacterized protein (TIGR00299 family) protein
MRILYLDCFSGISGDMTVGALCDLGVSPSTFEWELAKLDIGDFHTHFERKSRSGITGVKFSIHAGAEHSPEQHECSGSHSHEHDEASHALHHHPDAHEHGRRYDEIRTLIETSELTDFVKNHAQSIFRRIAVAEGKIHGVPTADIAFHEVGALDSIADIVCACVGIEQLTIDCIVASPLVEGRGWIDCAHGRFPVPAPAMLEILKDIPLSQSDSPHEMITPTGAAILAEFAERFSLMPAMRISKVGYGVGTRDLRSRPNVLRVVLGESAATADDGLKTDTITRIETNLDDLSPEIMGATMERLLSAGALDAFITPIQMKKNRPASQLTVLCDATRSEEMASIIFSETTSFGLRMEEMKRLKLERRFETVATPYGEVTVKVGMRGGKIMVISPEFESVRAISETSGQPLRTVFEAARFAAAKTLQC